jgi:hypothetical protein
VPTTTFTIGTPQVRVKALQYTGNNAEECWRFMGLPNRPDLHPIKWLMAHVFLFTKDFPIVDDGVGMYIVEVGENGPWKPCKTPAGWFSSFSKDFPRDYGVVKTQE